MGDGKEGADPKSPPTGQSFPPSVVF